MSKITNDCLTWACTGWFIAVPVWQQWTSKRYHSSSLVYSTTCRHWLSVADECIVRCCQLWWHFLCWNYETVVCCADRGLVITACQTDVGNLLMIISLQTVLPVLCNLMPFRSFYPSISM